MFRNRLTTSLVVLCALFAGSAVLASTASAGSAGDCPSADATAPSEARSAVLCLLNGERRARDLDPLRSNHRLADAAMRHSAHMAGANFFSHTTPSGTSMTDRVRRSGFTTGTRWWSIGENLAWGVGEAAAPRRIVAAWMRSPAHRANVLNGAFRQIGIGIASGAPVRVHASGAGATYTTNFGARR